MSILQDPDDPWWYTNASCQYPVAEMAVRDVHQMRSRLLAGPEDWDTDLLRFCLRHGIGYVRVPATS